MYNLEFRAINNNSKPFDVKIGDTVKSTEEGVFTVTGIYKHHFTATNGKWNTSFTKSQYGTGEVRKIDKQRKNRVSKKIQCLS